MADNPGSRGVNFIHLRAHSAYSLSEGALPIKQMAALAKEAQMPALAITDSGNLFGALEFSEALVEKGIQPIIGCSLKADLHPENAEAAGRANHGMKRFPVLALLAKDAVGYRNLMKLSSHAYLDTDDSSEPHVPLAFLKSHHEGLICLTGGPQGPVNDALVQGQTALARSIQTPAATTTLPMELMHCIPTPPAPSTQPMDSGHCSPILRATIMWQQVQMHFTRTPQELKTLPMEMERCIPTLMVSKKPPMDIYQCIPTLPEVLTPLMDLRRSIQILPELTTQLSDRRHSGATALEKITLLPDHTR